MRILQTALSFPPAYALGGPIKNIHMLSKELVKRGHQVTVWCTNFMDKHTKMSSGTFRKELDGIQVVHFNIMRLFPLGRGSFGLFVCPDLVQYASGQTKSFDIVHINGYRDFLALVLSHYSRAARVPYLIQARGTLPLDTNSTLAKRIYDQLLGINILKRASRLIAISEVEAQQYRDMIKRENTIRVVYNGLEINEFNSLPDPGFFKKCYGIRTRFLVLYLGRIHHGKGIQFLVKACAELYKEGADIALAIVGADEGYQHVLESLIERLSFRERVTFTGVLTGQTKLSSYLDADILAYPGRHELFGMVPLEAIMCNTPAIVADDSGCGEIMKRIGEGNLVRYGNVSQLKDTIVHILECPEEARDKTQKARQYIIQHLPWSKITSQVENVYREVLSESRQT